ncbi:MAG: hypothetical protein LUE08_00035, partial [Akkermansiaceae bacterium]|nr:hypothetical protein [Akkermansiaceae bacterium]
QERAQRVEDEITRLKQENKELTDEEARKQAEANVDATELGGTNAYVVYRNANGERVFRIANNSVSARELAEELGEQILRDWMRSENMTLHEAYKTLTDLKQVIFGNKEDRAQRVEDEITRLKQENGKLTNEEARKQAEANVDALAKSFLTLERRNKKLHKRLLDDRIADSDLTPEEYMEARNEIIETLSDIFTGELSIEAESRGSDFPDWARDLFRLVNTDGAALVRDVKLANTLADARAKGLMNETARKLLGVAPEAIQKALRGESTPSPDELRRSYAEKANRQAQLDAEYGRNGKSNLHDEKETEEFEKGCDEGQKELDKEKKQEEDQKSEQAKKDVDEIEKENPEMSHEQAVKTAGEKRADSKEEETAADPAAEEDKDFSGGKCVELTEEGGLPVKAGMISTDKLQILPNFKLGADPDTGEVHPITGDYRGDHDPIRVWRKSDGTLMVISGRHRLAACRRAGVSRIMCYVYDESPARNEAWARRFDVESNIRDNQATPLEVALYVRGEFTEGKALTDEEIQRAGISREGTLGSIGYRIGRNAGETVISNMRNGTIDERQALWIADFAPGSDKVQAAGVRLAIEGASKGEILARMEAEQALLNMQDEMGLSGGTDLFGGALDNDEFNNFAAKYVNRKRNSLGQDISYLNKLVGKKLSKEQAKKYGINIKDPEGLRKALDKLRLQQQEWQNPWVRRELMDEIRDAWKKENPTIAGSGELTDSKGGTGGKGGSDGTGGASFSVTAVKRGGKEPPVFKMLDLYHKRDLRGGGSFSVTVAKPVRDCVEELAAGRERGM